MSVGNTQTVDQILKHLHFKETEKLPLNITYKGPEMSVIVILHESLIENTDTNVFLCILSKIFPCCINKKSARLPLVHLCFFLLVQREAEMHLLNLWETTDCIKAVSDMPQ